MPPNVPHVRAEPAEPIGVALGVVAGAGRPGRSRIVAPVGARRLDVGSLAQVQQGPYPALLGAPTLDALLAAGRPAWRQVWEWLAAALADPERIAPYLLPDHGIVPVRPFTVADFVDFFACEQHATNAALIARPDGGRLTPNWRHVPVGYHGRAGSVQVSGTPVARPVGQRGAGDYGPTRELDFEAELGFVLGGAPGPVPMADALDHVFGVVLIDDWSARDVQRWESRPLGPLLGKAFATSISAWVTPLDELAGAWLDPPRRDPAPLDYLCGPADRGLDITLEVWLNGERISAAPAADLYWTPAQLVSHLSLGGAPLRPGDLLGSGTVSGPRPGQRGCLLELSWGGTRTLPLADGTTRTYLHDGDEVVITATAPRPDGDRVSLGEVRGTITPARPC